MCNIYVQSLFKEILPMKEFFPVNLVGFMEFFICFDHFYEAY